jgi:hypothetical protein
MWQRGSHPELAIMSMRCLLPSFGRDQAFELAIFAAGRAAASCLDAIEISTRLGEITLGDVQRAGVAQGRNVIWIRAQRLGVPGPRLVEMSELGIGKTDGAGDLWPDPLARARE